MIEDMAATLLQQVHREMLKGAVPLIQKLRKKQGDNISEDDIRDQFHKAFDKHPHRNLEYAQECNGRKDMAIRETGKNNPVILYELKTYFKDNEIFYQATAFGKITYDIGKLYKRKSDAKAYFILVCKKSQIDTCPDTNEFKFIKESGLGKVGLNKQYKVKDTFDEITVTVRHRILDNDFVILSWEVEKKPKPKKKKK